MAQEIYLYRPIDQTLAQQVNYYLNYFVADDRYKLPIFRMDCVGGNVSGGFSIISKLSETEGTRKLIVDGSAQSMGAIMLAFFDEVEINDTGTFMFHKAAFPKDVNPTAEQQRQLDWINQKFEEIMRAGGKVPEAVLNEIFSTEGRKDVYITPQKMIEYGLATKMRTLDIRRKSSLMAQAVAQAEDYDKNITRSPQGQAIETTKPSTMAINTLQDLQAQLPLIYAEALKVGVEQERKRAKDFLLHVKLPENTMANRAVQAIQKGEQYIDAMAELNVLAQAEIVAAAVQTENVPSLGTDPTTPQGDAQQLQTIQAQAGATQTPEQQAQAQAAAKYNEVMGMVPGWTPQAKQKLDITKESNVNK